MEREIKVGNLNTADYVGPIMRMVVALEKETGNNPNEILRILEGVTATVILSIEKMVEGTAREQLFKLFDLNVRSWMNSIKV